MLKAIARWFRKPEPVEYSIEYFTKLEVERRLKAGDPDILRVLFPEPEPENITFAEFLRRDRA